MRRGTVARDALALVRSEVASAPGTRWLDGAAEIRDDGSDRLLLATARAAWDGPPAGREVARARIVAGIRRVLDREGFPRAVVDLSLLE